MTEKPNEKPKLVENAASDDPFDLAKLRVSQDFFETTNVKKLLTTVPVRKPASTCMHPRNIGRPWRSSN